jgi:Tfp pilus assembly protein PilF
VPEARTAARAAPAPQASDARIAAAREQMQRGDHAAARRSLDDAMASGDDALKLVARKGFVALYWLKRIASAPANDASLRDEARRALRSTPWEHVF